MPSWHLLTGEYPPQPGGVGDYTRLLARGLAEAGDEVHVWAPGGDGSTAMDESVVVHRLPGHFGPRGLAALDAGLRRFPARQRLFVQYVPHAYGWKAMNVPFCLWLAACGNRPRWVMFHEVAYPIEAGQSWKHRLLARVTRFMARQVAAAAERIFVSIPGWEALLHQVCTRRPPVQWLPVPSNIPAEAAPEAVQRVRQRLGGPGRSILGHFGTFGGPVSSLLEELLPPLLRGDSARVALLLGRGGESFASMLQNKYPEMCGRVTATGPLPAAEVAAHLASCDLLVQPYPDGASSRRGSLMAGLALGLPIVTTCGPLSEPLWQQSGAVAQVPLDDRNALVRTASRLLADGPSRAALGARARAVYQEQFALDRLVERLRQAS